MGRMREVIRDILNEPWIPREKKAVKPKAKTGTEAAPSFCDPHSPKPCITVCTPPGGMCACNASGVRSALQEEIRGQRLGIQVGTAKAGCSGACAVGALVGFPQKGFFYKGVGLEQVGAIVQKTLGKGEILFSLLSVEPDRALRSDIYYDRRTGLLATIDDATSMVEVAKYFLDREAGLSCGKCIPCRIGLKRMQEALRRIESGAGRKTDLEELQALGRLMEEAPYCEFAAASSAPVLKAIAHFEAEFQALLLEEPEPVAPEPAGERPKRKEAKPQEPEAAAVEAAEEVLRAEALTSPSSLGSEAESRMPEVQKVTRRTEAAAEPEVMEAAPGTDPAEQAPMVPEQPPLVMEEPAVVPEEASESLAALPELRDDTLAEPAAGEPETVAPAEEGEPVAPVPPVVEEVTARPEAVAGTPPQAKPKAEKPKKAAGSKAPKAKVPKQKTSAKKKSGGSPKAKKKS